MHGEAHNKRQCEASSSTGLPAVGASLECVPELGGDPEIGAVSDGAFGKRAPDALAHLDFVAVVASACSRAQDKLTMEIVSVALLWKIILAMGKPSLTNSQDACSPS